MDLNMENLQFDSIEKRNFCVNVSAKELIDSETTLLSLTAYACCGRSEILNNEVVIEGSVKFYAIVKQNETIKSIEKCERFSLNENVSGIKPDSKMLTTASAEKIRGYVEAGNLMLSCSINVNALIVSPNECQFITELDGDEYRKKEEKLSVFKSTLVKPIRFFVSEDTELSPRVPEINKILTVDAFSEVKEAHISAGQLIIGGDVFLHTVYNSTDEYEPIVQVSDKFEFSQLIDLNEVDSGKPFVVLNVEDINTDVKLNEQGESRIINYNIGLSGYAYSGIETECNVIKDAYSIKNKIQCESDKIRFVKAGEEFGSLLNKSINVRVPNGNNPISRINSVTFIPKINTCEIIDSTAHLICSGEIGVIYTASTTGQTEGFNTTVNFEIITENSVFSDVNDVIAFIKLNEMQAVLLTGNEIEIRSGLSVRFVPEYFSESVVLKNINSLEDNDFPEFGIIIYNVQKGDSLWEICKKYGVDEEDIKKLNRDIDDTPEAGRKIYIFRKIAV